MTGLKLVGTGALCGIIFIIGIYNQFKIFNKLFNSFRFYWVYTFPSYLILILLFTFALMIRGCSFFQPYVEAINYQHYFTLIIAYLVIVIFCCRSDYHFEILHERAWNKIFFIPMCLSFSITLLTLFGSTIAFVLSEVDTKISANLEYYINISKGVAILALAFFIKSLFGVLLITSTCIWFIWNFFIHGELSLIPVFSIILDIVATKLPVWTGYIYITLTIMYSTFQLLLASNIHSFHDSLSP